MSADIKLGGIGKFYDDQRRQLEKTVGLLKGELEALRGVLRSNEAKAVEQEILIKSLFTKVFLQNLKLESNSATLKEQSDKISSLSNNLEKLKGEYLLREDEIQCLLIEKESLQSRCDAQVNDNSVLQSKLLHWKDESEKLQRQYDMMEERAERAEDHLIKQKQANEILLKAKSQKENQILVLVKKRNQLQKKNAQLQIHLKRRTNRKSSINELVLEDQDENERDSGIGNQTCTMRPMASKHATDYISNSQKEMLSKFDGCSRMKARLATTMAQKIKAETEVAQLKEENAALRIRYRNAILMRK